MTPPGAGGQAEGGGAVDRVLPRARCPPALVEIAARQGFDLVVVEYEHGLLDLETIERMILTARSWDVPTWSG